VANSTAEGAEGAKAEHKRGHAGVEDEGVEDDGVEDEGVEDEGVEDGEGEAAGVGLDSASATMFLGPSR